jgi:hypothetical protein
MFYVIAVKGWPVLVWLAQEPARYEVISATDDVLRAVALYHDALEAARERVRSLYAAGGGNSMSPRPPAAKNRATYDSLT